MRYWNKKEWYKAAIGLGNPVFHAGILASDGPDKGVVLVSFLNRVDWRPERVIFIDDSLPFLIYVQNSMEELGIPFIGIHYKAVRKEILDLDHEIAHLQFHHLANHGIWMTDEHARLKLSKGSASHPHKNESENAPE